MLAQRAFHSVHTSPLSVSLAQAASLLQRDRMHAIPIYVAAALAEIAGCFAFWAWLRLDRSILWLVPGMASLAAFGWLLTLAPVEHAGRAYAVYGGVYIVASLAWLWAVEGLRPDRWDLIGGAISLVGAGIILWAPRAIP
jgi:small multidrug resistance family-3 protein